MSSIHTASVSSLYQPPGSVARWIMIALAAAASLLASFMAWLSLSGQLPPGCSGESAWFDCAALLSSPKAYWLPFVPVSLGGAAVYLTMSIALLFTGSDEPPRNQRWAWRVLVTLAIVAIGAAGWFIAAQALGGQWCALCLTIHVLGVTASIMVLARAPWREGAEGGRMQLRGRPLAAVAGAGALMLAAMILGPVLLPHDTMQVRDMSPKLAGVPAPTAPPALPPVDSQLAAPTPPTASTTAPAFSPLPIAEQRKRLMYYFPRARHVTIDAYDEPILGHPAAPVVIAKMLDYTCEYCRMLHHQLEAARRRYGSDLAILIIPVPLNPACNQHVRRANPVNAEACELAKLALAVWMLKPRQFDAFHHWMFEASAPRTHAAARAKAMEIIGDAELLDETLASHRLNMRIVRNVQLYDIAERGSLPKLLLGQRLLLGPARDEESLFEHLEANSRLKPPAP